jgi:hypothetical protein
MLGTAARLSLFLLLAGTQPAHARVPSLPSEPVPHCKLGRTADGICLAPSREGSTVQPQRKGHPPPFLPGPGK